MGKERAIATAINAAVEAFIEDDMTDADYYFEMAEEFHHADESLFSDDTNNYTRS